MLEDFGTDLRKEIYRGEFPIKDKNEILRKLPKSFDYDYVKVVHKNIDSVVVIAYKRIIC